MKKLFAAVGILSLLALAGCGTVSTIGTVLAGGVTNPITPKMVFELRGAYDAVEVVGLNYIRLPLCSAKHRPPGCSDASVSASIKAYAAKARTGLRNLDAFVEANPKLDATSFYSAAVAAVNTLRNVTPTP